MKIAYSISEIDYSGGTERVLCTKANYFADVLGYEVHIIVLKKAEKTFFPFSSRIYIHYLNIDNMNHKPWMIAGSRSKKEYKRQLFQKLNEIKPDITISVFGLDAEFLYQSKDGSKKLLEFHFSKNYLLHLEKGLRRKQSLLRKIWLKYLLKRQAYYASKYENIVLLTEQDKKLWGGGKKYTVITNPLSFFSEEAAPLENKQIIAVGSTFPQKGFDLLIDAFALIASEFPDWTLSIYGEGQDFDFLVQKTKQLNLEKQVFIRKPIKEVKQKMLESSIFAFSSRYEGFGLVLTEAMECGLPCVAFDIECGPGEIIDAEKTGLLVDSLNISFFAEALKKLMGDAHLRKKMGEMAKKRVTHFYPENIMPLWVGLFNRILKEKK